jgi:hypothetical protein
MDIELQIQWCSERKCNFRLAMVAEFQIPLSKVFAVRAGAVVLPGRVVEIRPVTFSSSHKFQTTFLLRFLSWLNRQGVWVWFSKYLPVMPLSDGLVAQNNGVAAPCCGDSQPP